MKLMHAFRYVSVWLDTMTQFFLGIFDRGRLLLQVISTAGRGRVRVSPI